MDWWTLDDYPRALFTWNPVRVLSIGWQGTFTLFYYVNEVIIRRKPSSYFILWGVSIYSLQSSKCCHEAIKRIGNFLFGVDITNFPTICWIAFAEAPSVFISIPWRAEWHHFFPTSESFLLYFILPIIISWIESFKYRFCSSS